MNVKRTPDYTDAEYPTSKMVGLIRILQHTKWRSGKLPIFKCRRLRADMILLYNIINNRMDNIFKLHSSSVTNTRGNTNKLFQRHTHNDLFR
jgi:hypothetical protein